MNHELVKQLKAAGYVFRLFPWELLHNRQRASDFRTCVLDNEIYFLPTLAELIDACGVHSAGLPVFKQLNWHATARQTPGICPTPQGNVDMREVGEWSAKARIGKGHTGHMTAWGFTPEEAVANLWLSLHTTKTNS